MDDLDQVTRILIAYARHGFDKVTMAQIAAAAHVTRQTLYNRYKTKEVILAWASESFSRHARAKACAKLINSEASTSDCLVTAFSERMGILVPLVHSHRYGQEILDLGTRLRREAQSDFEPFHADFTKELTHFLQARGVCQSLAEAEGTTYLLMMSGKGLLMSTRTLQQFESGMARVVAAVLHETPSSNQPNVPSLCDTAEHFPASGGGNQRSKPGVKP